MKPTNSRQSEMIRSFFNNYKNLFILFAWIPLVILIFKFIHPKEVASLFAGVGFILIPIFLLYSRRHEVRSSPFWCFSVIQFLLLFAVPIFTLRILYWGTPFQDISVNGFQPTEFLHKGANMSYLVMLLAEILKVKRTKS